MRLTRPFNGAAAALIGVGGYVHYCLYRSGYRTIPKIGVGFALQVAASAGVAIALLAGPHVLARATHLPEHVAGAAVNAAAAGLAASTLLAFALTRTPAGLFNFRERGLEPAPQALIALVAEAGVLVLVAAPAILRKVRVQRV